MTSDTKPENQEQRLASLAPETHNNEQDDHESQAQQVAEDARALTPATESPTESEKGSGDSGLMGDSTQDLVDHMKDMEQSGRIDMGAFRGEPNFDDEDDKFGKGHNPDGESEEEDGSLGQSAKR